MHKVYTEKNMSLTAIQRSFQRYLNDKNTPGTESWKLVAASQKNLGNKRQRNQAKRRPSSKQRGRGRTIWCWPVRRHRTQRTLCSCSCILVFVHETKVERYAGAMSFVIERFGCRWSLVWLADRKPGHAQGRVKVARELYSPNCTPLNAKDVRRSIRLEATVEMNVPEVSFCLAEKYNRQPNVVRETAALNN